MNLLSGSLVNKSKLNDSMLSSLRKAKKHVIAMHEAISNNLTYFMLRLLHFVRNDEKPLFGVN